MLLEDLRLITIALHQLVQSINPIPDFQENQMLYLKDLKHSLVLIHLDTWVLSYGLVSHKILKT